MAKKRLMGIEIGNYKMKIAACIDGVIERYIEVKLPENLVREDEIVSWEAMADFIKETVTEEKLAYKNVAIALPDKLTYIANITMPLMTVDQLNVNLPYEFHDYITEDVDKYFYDYAVINTRKKEEKGSEMDLIGVAILKDTMEKYKTMFRRAGLRLVQAAPEISGFRNIIKDYEEQNSITAREHDYAIIDLGGRTVKLHFFNRGEYEITRVMEPGCSALTEAVAEDENIDTHRAQLLIENDSTMYNIEKLADIYNQMAVEVMRVINFYGFNHPDNKLNRIYYCGEGAAIKPLIDAIAQTSGYELTSIADLITDKTKFIDDIVQGPQALGIVWE